MKHLLPEIYPRIALTGAERSGKDAAGLILSQIGLTRYAFGDLIKARIACAPDWQVFRMMDRLQQHPIVPGLSGAVARGFFLIRSGAIDSFTEDDADKALIRPALEQYGEAFWDELMRDYYQGLPEYAVNTRLIKDHEAQAWIEHGGVVFEVTRPGKAPLTQWSADRLAELRQAGYVKGTIENKGTLAELTASVLSTCRREA